MSVNGFVLVCCNRLLKEADLWILKDINGFTARKLIIAKCPVCGDYAVTLAETRLTDGKIFVNKYTHLAAAKVLYREKKRTVTKIFDIKQDCLDGWIYGVNVQIKNKKGCISQLRQYAADFNGKKALVKKDFLAC